MTTGLILVALIATLAMPPALAFPLAAVLALALAWKVVR